MWLIFMTIWHSWFAQATWLILIKNSGEQDHARPTIVIADLTRPGHPGPLLPCGLCKWGLGLGRAILASTVRVWTGHLSLTWHRCRLSVHENSRSIRTPQLLTFKCCGLWNVHHSDALRSSSFISCFALHRPRDQFVGRLPSGSSGWLGEARARALPDMASARSEHGNSLKQIPQLIREFPSIPPRRYHRYEGWPWKSGKVVVARISQTHRRRIVEDRHGRWWAYGCRHLATHLLDRTPVTIVYATSNYSSWNGQDGAAEADFLCV